MKKLRFTESQVASVPMRLIATSRKDLASMRDRVMLVLGYESMWRRSELYTFRVEDIEHLTKHKVDIQLRFSKTGQFSEGKLIPISLALAALVENQRRNTKIHSSHILQEVTKTGRIKPIMRPASINLRLKYLQRTVNLNQCAELSGPSLRVEGEVALLEAGESLAVAGSRSRQPRDILGTGARSLDRAHVSAAS